MGKMLKLAELSHFLADFGPLINVSGSNFQFSRHKEFLKSGGIDDSMQHHFG